MSIQSSGGIKNSTTCARKIRMSRTTKKIISFREMTNEDGVAEMTNDPAKRERMTKQTRMPNNEKKITDASSFGFHASSFLRHSSFVIRHSPSSFSSRHNEDILKVRKIHRRRHPRLAIQFADAKTLDRADEQPRGENAPNSGRVNLRVGIQVRLLGKKIQIEHRRDRTRHAFARDDPLLPAPFDRAG